MLWHRAKLCPRLGLAVEPGIRAPIHSTSSHQEKPLLCIPLLMPFPILRRTVGSVHVPIYNTGFPPWIPMIYDLE